MEIEEVKARLHEYLKPYKGGELPAELDVLALLADHDRLTRELEEARADSERLEAELHKAGAEIARMMIRRAE